MSIPKSSYEMQDKEIAQRASCGSLMPLAHILQRRALHRFNDGIQPTMQ